MKISGLLFSILFCFMLASSLLSCSSVVDTTSYSFDLSSLQKVSNNIQGLKTLISEDVSSDSVNKPLLNNIKLKTVNKIVVKKLDNIEIRTESPIKVKKIIIKKRQPTNWVITYKPFNFEVNKVIVADTLPRPIKKKKLILKNKINNVSDRISTVLAATEKSSENNTLISKGQVPKQPMKEEIGDLVFFDYSASRNLTSDTTKNAHSKIEQSLNNEVEKNIIKNENKVSKLSKNSNLKNFVSSNNIKNLLDDSNKLKSITNKVTTQKRVFKSDYSLSPYLVKKNGIIKNLTNFELRFKDDVDDILHDFGNSIVKVQNKLASKMSIRRATIYSSGIMPLSLDLALESDQILAKVPVIDQEYFNQIVEQNKLKGIGGHLLVELDDLTEDADLDSNYEAKLFLNHKFRVVNADDNDYSYILFIGASVGNNVLNFRTTKNEIISKIIHIEDEYILFDSNFYIEQKREAITFFEENLLSKKSSPLTLKASELSNFSFNTKYVKKSLNSVESIKSLYPLGTRKYLELSHLNESVFVGFWDKKDIDIPSNDYMNFIINSFQNSNIYGTCVVQLNLSNSVKDISYTGTNGSKFMNVDKLILDKDGVFYDSFGPNTKKVFLMAQEQGIINIKVSYTNNSNDYLQSYCSDSTYLIEQL